MLLAPCVPGCADMLEDQVRSELTSPCSLPSGARRNRASRAVVGYVFSVLWLVLGAVGVAAAQEAVESTVSFTVPLREHVAVEMGATVLVNPRSPVRGLKVLVVHGLAETANTFRPLAEDLVDPARRSPRGAPISRVVLLDLPGRGNSGLPVGGGVRFGDLTLDDYVTSLLGSLDQLRRHRLAPDLIVAHSLGATVVMLAQDRLVSEGTNLRRRFGVQGAVFVVPDIPAPAPWFFVDSGHGALAASSLLRLDDQLGLVFELPPEAWLGWHFLDAAGLLASGTPSREEVIERGYLAAEPGGVAGALFAIPGFPNRPSIDLGIFDDESRTPATIVAADGDALYIYPIEHRILYDFLTGDPESTRFHPFADANAVHGLHIIAPQAVGRIVRDAAEKIRPRPVVR